MHYIYNIYIMYICVYYYVYEGVKFYHLRLWAREKKSYRQVRRIYVRGMEDCPRDRESERETPVGAKRIK